MRVQPKLTVNQPGDPYEQEADRVADRVMRMPAGEALQRMCPACEEEQQVQRKSMTVPAAEEEEEHLQTKREAASLAPGPEAGAAPPIVDDVLRSSGEPLDHHTRHFMESRFGHDFGGVRVHAGAQASASARAVQALAYTVGNNIVFGPGRYAPSEGSGRRLLAHELTHVIQQTGGGGARAAQRSPGRTGPAPRPSANALWTQLAMRSVGGGAGVYGSPTQSSASTSPNCLKSEAAAKSERLSYKLYTSEQKPPCLACPNSDSNACPKLADRSYIRTGPVQFSWQVKFLTWTREGGSYKNAAGKYSHVIQKIEKNFNFTNPPTGDYKYTSPYWEAFDVRPGGQSGIDHWQFEIPDGTSGNWSMSGTLYLVEQLPDGMAIGNVPDASGAPSTATEPEGLGRVLGTRRIGAVFDFTGPNKKHHQ